MPRVAVDSKHLFTFVKGLVTESSGITYPENSMVDGDNVDIGISGICRRRKGLDFEEGYSLTPAIYSITPDEFATNAITVHEWHSVGGDGNLNFWVMQVGTSLFIGNMGKAALSDGFLGKISLEDIYSTHYDKVGNYKFIPFLVNTEQAKFHAMSASYGKGRMFLTSKYTEPFYLEYDKDNSYMRLRMIHMQERDYLGVDDNHAVDQQPDELTGNHAYNLMNQGWSDTDVTTLGMNEPEGMTTVLTPTVGETTFSMLPL